MCGIVAYVGKNQCRQFIFDGLAKLEYRGYDSVGIACVDAKSNHILFHKEIGGVDFLKKSLESVHFDGHLGMGHTRWATHGVVNHTNAHPHFNCDSSIAVVHNGIIENYEKLRNELLSLGHQFSSSTDSEVAAHLFSQYLKESGSLEQATLRFTQAASGAYALAIMFESFPDKLLLIRHRCPLALGKNDREVFIASDLLAFSHLTSEVCFLPDDSFTIVTQDMIKCYNFQGEPLSLSFETIEQNIAAHDKDGFEHYMLKEIYEQKRAITRSIHFCKIIGGGTSNTASTSFEAHRNQDTSSEYSDHIWRQLGITKDFIKKLKSINLVAAGTSWHAARIAQFFFEIVAQIPTQVYLASEFRYMPFFSKEDTLYIMVSQSGETADTLEALRLVNSFDLPTVVITNVASSSMVRESGGFLLMQAGPEISVASTKAFSTQVAVFYWLAYRIALERNLISWNEMHEAEEDLFITAELLEATIEIYKLAITQDLAPRYAQFDRFIFLGRHINYPFAMEAALKLKEISYIFSQCYPAGELKHGPIALIDDKIPVVLFSILDEILYWKIVSNAQEVKARQGHIIAFVFEGQTELAQLADTVFVIPKVKPLLAPLVMTGLMQFFIYHITKALNRPIDKPRNLAKSVTVE